MWKNHLEKKKKKLKPYKGWHRENWQQWTEPPKAKTGLKAEEIDEIRHKKWHPDAMLVILVVGVGRDRESATFTHQKNRKNRHFE